jgi:5-methylcytosine-specific restriction endonuclease McrA
MTSARDLTARLVDLLRSERQAMADFLVALADFDRRRVWLDLGYASLFYFLHRELGLSKGAAHYRKTGAELVLRFPEIVEPLRDGRLCITSIVHLAKVITPENRDEMLPRFFHRSRREAMEVAAAIRPAEAAPRREVVTAVRTPARAVAVDTKPPASPARVERAVQPAELTLVPPAAANAAPPPVQPRRDSVEPITAELSRFHVTVSRRFLEKLEAARAALSHSHPGANAEEILEAGLDLLLARHATRRGLVAKPRNVLEKAPAPKSNHVPAHVKRAVWKRDQGRCQWPVEGGGICGSTHKVEIDHVVPKGRGGPATIENTRLLCRVHNEYAARRVYGDEWMNRFTHKHAKEQLRPG